ncbi:MAG TPA: hypothetical protein VGC17_06500 [Lactovum miscens]|uniref:hypothetical protein n=1 Tax=Lactovum miscens TaxID=190387 RepID=UPI002ED9C88B
MDYPNNSDSESDVEGNPYLSDENKNKNEDSSKERDTSIVSSSSSNAQEMKKSSTALSEIEKIEKIEKIETGAEVTSKTEMSPDAKKNSTPDTDKTLPSTNTNTNTNTDTDTDIDTNTNPSSANHSQKSQGTTDSVNISSDTKKIDDKKLTPGDYLDDMPQEMPGPWDDGD